MNPPAVLTNINQNEAFIVQEDSEVYTGPQSEDAEGDPAQAALWTKGNSEINGVSPQEVRHFSGTLAGAFRNVCVPHVKKATTIHHFKRGNHILHTTTKLNKVILALFSRPSLPGGLRSAC